MDVTTQYFIKDVINDCTNNKVKIKLQQKNFVKLGDMKVNGFFSSHAGNAILAVAMKKDEPKWLKTLVHEYCHMQQWKENCPEWENLKLSDSLNADDVMDSWLSGKKYTNLMLDKAFHVVMMMELDCEKRVVKAIQKYKLNIDVVEYIQRANAYVLFYKIIRKYKKWYTINKEPYNIEEIWKKMPKTFKNIYDKPLSPKHEKLLLTCLD